MENENIKPQLGPFPGQMHYTTAKAIEVLKHGTPGQTITRAAMAEEIGRSCELGTNGYGNVNSAIRHVENHHGVVWRWDREAKAWRCLGAGECVTESETQIKGARKRAARSLRVAKAVDVAKLDDDQRRDHNLNVAVASMLTATGGGAFRKRLAEKPSLRQPDTGKVLALFGNGEAKG